MKAVEIQVLGCHAFGADPWRLIDVQVTGLDEPLDLASWSLPAPGLPRENWQAPYNEHLLTSDGWVRWGVDGDLDTPASRSLRLCFWLYMMAEGPLLTPSGEVAIPASTPLPEHLASLAFEAP